MAAIDITSVAAIRCPPALRDLQAWLIWRFEPNDNPGGKPRKVPYYVDGARRQGQQGTREDQARLTTFDMAKAAAARRRFDGVGLALLPEHGIVAMDFDACVEGGKVHPEVLATLGDTYAELSPSGTGVRALFKGNLGDRKSHKKGDLPFGVETFSTKGYVTFTGHVLDITSILGNEDTVAPVNAETIDLVQRRFKRELERDAFGGEQNADVVGLTPSQIQRALEALPKDLDYDTWVQTGMALHHEFGGSAEGFEVWDTWSQGSPKYTTREYGMDRWRSFGQNQGVHVTARSLVHLANEHGAGIDLNAPASAEDFEDVSGASATPAKPAKPPRFQVLRPDEFASRPRPSWIVKHLLPQAGLCVLYGESGAGKSFVTLDIAASIARGLPWRGKRTRQGRVVYICAEGAGGFRNRLEAYALHHGISLAEVGVEVIAGQPNLLQKDDALDIARAIGKADVVIVDTLAQTMAGGNENAGEDVGKVLAHCAGIHRATGALVILVHHSGKDVTRGSRGWSGIKAAADAELEVIRTPSGVRQLRTSKMKDGDDNLAWGFGLETVVLGTDEDGDQITSCVVVEAEVPTAQLSRKLGPNEEVVNAVIQEFAKDQTSGIEVTAVINEAVRRMPEPEDGKRDTRKQRARRALEALTTGDDAPYWLDGDCVALC